MADPSRAPGSKLELLLTVALAFIGVAAPFGLHGALPVDLQVAAAADSGFVEIVENHTDGGLDPRWTVDTVPAIEIGIRDGDRRYELSMVVNAGRFESGTVWVVDRMRTEILFYDRDGRFLTSAGGRGEGPGEFRTLSAAMAYRGDSIVAWDGASRRMTVLDDRGRAGRTFTVRLPPPAVQGTGASQMIIGASLVGSLLDGSVIVEAPSIYRPEPGVRARRQVRFVRYGVEGDSLGVIGPAPGPEFRGPREGQPPSSATPFPQPSLRAVHGNRVYIATGPSYEITVHDLSGSLRRVIRLEREEVLVDDRARDAFLQAQRSALSERGLEPARVDAALGDVSFPDTAPPYSDLHLDSQGRLWVKDYALPGREGPVLWHVFDETGTLLGTARLPRGISVEWIGDDAVVAIWTDEFDVPHVRLYELREVR